MRRPWRRLRLRLAAALLVAPSALRAAAPASPPVVDYTIAVSLNPDAKTLDGQETLIWRNPSADPVAELRFHLYLNAFKNNRSTFMRESGGQLRGDEAGTRPDDWGWIDVASLSADGVELSRAARFVAPRWQRRGGRDGPRRAAAAPGAAAWRHHPRDRLPREAAQDLRPDRLRARLLPGRPVVPEDRGLRAGGHARPQYGRLELPRIPRELRVLRRLRALRRLAHRAEPVRRRRHRQARVRDAQGRPHDLPLCPGRRPRLRLDGRPALPGHRVRLRPGPRRSGRLERKGRARARDDGGTRSRCRPIPQVRLLLQPGHERARDRYLRSIKEGIAYYGLWYGAIPVRDPHGRGSAGRRRGLRGNGVPDVHHGRRVGRLADAMAPLGNSGRRDRDGARVRPPVLVRHGRLQRVRRAVARRGAQRRLRAPRDVPGVRAAGHGRAPRRPRRRTPSPSRTPSTTSCRTSTRSGAARGASPPTPPTM